MVLLAGCNRGGQIAPAPALGSAAPAQPPAVAQHQQWEQQVGGLHRDNEQLHTMVAQLQQMLQLRDEELATTREQLRTASSQLAKFRAERDEAEQKLQNLTASLQRRGAATITANSSLRASLPEISIDGVEVRVDGDVIRIELPADQLFVFNSHQLLPSATALVDRVAAEVRRTYPDQMIGVEGHTDNAPVQSPLFVHNHQLSVTRALAVFDLLSSRGYFPAEQLMLVGHGANHPVVSNATSAGRQRNRRVELVIYPDKFQRRAN